uniref:Ig-like domain-containing protein n=1 Tax=Salmo trutta TaxID=8032 RepID=A0A674F292_SALTR
VLASNKSKALATKTEISEQVLKKEIVYGEVESYTEIKASHTQMAMTEGQSLTLKANIPRASDIRWILNGMELANSEDYRYGVSGNNHTMTIKKVSQYEQGVITCEAKTEHGLVKCQFNTTVTEARSDAPSFLVQPRSQNVNEGQNVKFTCEIAGEPAPEIEWFKDNIMISMTSNTKLSRSKNVYTLEIIEATVADSGKYTIKAKNKYGQCSATSSLNIITLVEEPAKMVIMEQRAAAASLHSDSFSATSVHMAGASMAKASMAHEGSFQRQFESMSAASMSAMTSESMVSMSSSSMMKMSIDTLINSYLFFSHCPVAPKIEFLPEDISIELGRPLSVSCAFSGDPTPEIEWTRTGKQCDEDSDRFHIETTEDLTTLVIPCVKEDDAGAYTLKLSNKLGSAMATVNIHTRSM